MVQTHLTAVLCLQRGREALKCSRGSQALQSMRPWPNYLTLSFHSKPSVGAWNFLDL